VGTDVSSGDEVIVIRHRGGRGLAEARRLLAAAMVIGDGRPSRRPLILERIEQRKG